MATGGHSTRTLFVSTKNPDILLVSVGSDGNIDPNTRRRDSGRSQIRAFSVSGIARKSVKYTDGIILGWGLRNSVGIAENPVGGGIVSLERTS